MPRSVSQRVKEYNEILHRWFEFYEKDKRALIRFCYQKNIPAREIAEALGVSRVQLSTRYPKGDLV